MFFRVRCAVAQCFGHVRAPFCVALLTVFGAVSTGIGLGHIFSQDGSDQQRSSAARTTTAVLQDNSEWLSEESWRRRLKGRRSSSVASRGDSLELSDQEREARRLNMLASGRYRTVCVRLCDGYYFPISFSTTRRQLASDESACQSRCNSNARLFYYDTSAGSPETMVDRAGRSYSDLKTAFLYRTKFEQSCQCRPAPWSKEAQQRHAMYRTKGWKKKAVRLARLARQRRLKAARQISRQPIFVSGGDLENKLPSTGIAGLNPVAGRMSLGGRSSGSVKTTRRRVVKRRKSAWKKSIFYSGSD
jgi:Protein of unknown function (DUF2865)